MNALKQVKGTGRILSTVKADGYTTAVVAVDDKIDVYQVEKQADEVFTVRKIVGGVSVETYSTSYWYGHCTCKGFKNGYNCRHMRMCRALEINKKI